MGKDNVASITVKKELDTLRSAWNCGARMAYVEGSSPSAGLVYPKSEDKPVFMTRKEIDRRIAQGGDPKELWEAFYLTEPEINEFLDFAQARKAQCWSIRCVSWPPTPARAARR